MAEDYIHRCSFLFLLSPVLVFWGILIIGASLGTLSVTSSYLDVFPFGEPLWSGSLVSYTLQCSASPSFDVAVVYTTASTDRRLHGGRPQTHRPDSDTVKQGTSKYYSGVGMRNCNCTVFIYMGGYADVFFSVG